ncbi:MAG TPA: outer membrane beta-barrel protein [Flavobacteriales bacterium]|nr:outer membrane beta-barrel protein [Flavobacteriales bacterium]
MKPSHLLLILFIAVSSGAFAQPPAGAPRTRDGGRAPAIGRIYGRVLDAETHKGAEFTTVTVFLASKDTVLGGAITRGNGEFEVEKLLVGPPLRVVISFIGYKPIEQRVQLTRDRMEMDLGNLTLETDSKLLKEAEIVAEKSTMTMQVDRRVFNVEKDLSTKGGSGVDVMKNVPGLSVDLDGNVSMRGASPQILIDGRPSSMTLDMIPASEIERVEVITNPSVAFDANSTGGIINVVLKKNTKPGYNGQVQGGIGTNGRRQANANLNMKEGRWGFNASYNYNTGENVTNGNTERADRSNGETIDYFSQNVNSTTSRTMNGGRLGVDWQLSNRNTLTASVGMRGNENDGTDNMLSRTLSAERSLLQSGSQINTSNSGTKSYTGQIAFRRKSPKPGHEWTADLNYNSWDRNSSAYFDQRTFGSDGSLSSTSPRNQANLGGSHYDQVTFLFDHVAPVGDKDKIEYGVKSNVRRDNTYLNVFVTSPLVGNNVLDTSLTNSYRITDIVNAAYFNWGHKLTDHWSYQAGVRLEQTWFETELLGKNKVFSYKYPDGAQNLEKAFFPAVYFSRKWEGSLREIQVNLSRKISRPNFWQIMPFIMFSDSRNVRIGNPTLAPELSNLAEVNHLLPFFKGKASWLTSLFGRYTTGVITSYSKPLPTDPQYLLSTFVNGSYSISSGWENILKIEPKTGLQFTVSGTVQWTDVALNSTQGNLRNQGANWNSKAMVSYKVFKDWTVQFNGEYESPRIQPQGKSIAQYGLDANVSHDFSKKLNATLGVNDMFYTRKGGSIIDTPYLYQDSFRRREMRFVRFTLTWKFGEQNTSLFRKKSQRQEPGTGSGDGEM